MAEGSVDFPAGSDGKRIRLQCGRPLLGRSSGEENGYPLQYSCLENSKNRGAWQAIVHGVTESDMTELLTEGSVNAQNHLGNHFGNIGLKLKICIIISFCLREILNHVQ